MHFYLVVLAWSTLILFSFYHLNRPSIGGHNNSLGIFASDDNNRQDKV